MNNRSVALQSELMGQVPGVRHGFFTRQGGVSLLQFESLNCSLSSGDEKWRLHENRKRVAAKLGLKAEKLVTLTQIHSRKVWEVKSMADSGPPRDGDGMVTRQPGVALGILTADCVPLLFADAAAGVIGAAHAGWKGALQGVAEVVLEEMCVLGARRDRIVVATGPCIQRDSYQVDAVFFERFVAQSPLNVEPFFSHDEGRYYFDLPAYLAARLHAAGMEKIEQLNLDTYCDERKFFSYRRSTHRGETRYGRQISTITLAAT